MARWNDGLILGDDVDTVAAIAGDLAGLYYGYDSMPLDWVQAIQKLDYVLDLIDLDGITR